jgi:predicted enzyme related to lactoylglutathione lyase
MKDVLPLLFYSALPSLSLQDRTTRERSARSQRKFTLGENSMAHAFVHVELNTPDPNKAKAFYSKLFEWQLEDVPNPAVPDDVYTMIKVVKGTGGGIMKQIPGGPAGWLAYVEVDDIHAATQKAKSLGAKIMKDVTEVAGMGWFTFIQDPTGAALGLWQTRAT